MRNANPRFFREQLDRLQAELAELAFTLDGRGQPDAADVAMTVHARIGELREELAALEEAGESNPNLNQAANRPVHSLVH